MRGEGVPKKGGLELNNNKERTWNLDAQACQKQRCTLGYQLYGLWLNFNGKIDSGCLY